MTKRRKRKLKFRFRFLLAFVVFSGITLALGYNLLSNIRSINAMKVTKAEMKEKIASLEDEKEELESDILKLNDPEYIAKYVREKYFYSKEGEVILRIED